MLRDTTLQGERIGYVLKMFPRFSETFIVSEILALEEREVDLEIFSLRMPNDGRFHADLARVQAPVHYLQPGSLRAENLWAAVAEYVATFGRLDDQHLEELLRVAPREAAQALDLARAIAATGVTHLHAHFGSVATTVARLAARLAGIDYTFTAHAKDIFHEEVDPTDLRRKLADAAAVVTVSDFNLSHLREEYGPDAHRVHRIYNGIDLQRFEFRAGRESGAEPPLIAAVGRLVEKKGFEHLVDAVAVLRERGVDVQVEIAGTGPMAEPLARQIAALGLQDRVRLLGPLPQDRVRELVCRATAFVAPCLVGADGNRDGLPTVLLEAMALGTPCVTTPVTGIPEAIEHGLTGLLVPERDSIGLAAALGDLLADSRLRARLAARARARVEDEYDVRQQAGKVADLFAAVARTPEVAR